MDGGDIAMIRDKVGFLSPQLSARALPYHFPKTETNQRH
jgi:hypothetical protein